jgi:hypothetical protein
MAMASDGVEKKKRHKDKLCQVQRGGVRSAWVRCRRVPQVALLCFSWCMQCEDCLRKCEVCWSYIQRGLEPPKH